MTDIILKLFIKDDQNKNDSEVRLKYGFVSSVVGIICNFLLFLAKLATGIFINSIAIIADAVNNLSDMGSSIITLVGFKMAKKPADKEHPYGHGRVEYISGFVVSIVILFLGLELLKSSVQKIFNPQEIYISAASIIVLTVSVFLKLWMCLFYRNISKKICSKTLIAASFDSLSDAVSTLAILLSIIVIKFTSLQIDGYAGGAVAIFILITGTRMVRDTISPLLGEKSDPQFVNNVTQTVLSFEEILGIHDLMVHDYGHGQKFISLHAEVSKDREIMKSHDVIDQCERALCEKFNASFVIHMDPVETDNEHVNNLKEDVTKIIRELDCRMTIHDFRAVVGESRTNLIFDLVIPFDVISNSNTIVESISKKVLEAHPDHYCIIHVDNLFV